MSCSSTESKDNWEIPEIGLPLKMEAMGEVRFKTIQRDITIDPSFEFPNMGISWWPSLVGRGDFTPDMENTEGIPRSSMQGFPDIF